MNDATQKKGPRTVVRLILLSIGVALCGGLYEGFTGKHVLPEGWRSIVHGNDTCNTSQPSSCTELGTQYKYGTGVTQDPKRAAELYELGCKGGDAPGLGS